jgi:hypothetical protein
MRSPKEAFAWFWVDAMRGHSTVADATGAGATLGPV